ncbi:speriolin [Equus przewalskii]|uniref:Spermatosis and centriole associated 1 n=2 Tax=Equus TaxID=9789 RepID=A0A9L0R7U5_HORSE|nr:speriolin isoform X2 [Equus caballus]
MSLLTNYEGLRHQIERLVRENEELKKLVRLIRENHELKSAIKTQAGGLGISGFSSGLGEAAAGASQCQGVFLSPSPTAASEPVLEEVGMVTLAPLADMLNSPQPSPAAGPIMSPLTGPLNTLLPGSGPMPQSSPLTSLLTGPLSRHLASPMGLPSTGSLTPSSHLASPMAVPPAGTLASPMGLPSTGPLTLSSHLANPMAVPPAGTLASSMGLPSTGPLTPSSHLASPMALSLGSPLLTSTPAPLGVPQNLLANPISNLGLSEAPRVRLAEPLRGSPSGHHPSAGTRPAATSKVPLSTEHPRPSQDPEPLSVAFVGVPIQTSTPIGTGGTPGPVTAFSYSTSDARTQPGVPQGQAVPSSDPTSPTAALTVTGLASAPTPAPQAATNHTPSSTTHITQCTPNSTCRPSATSHSPPRNPLSPLRASSSPASVNNNRGARVSETSRKSILELERKLAHRKASKFPDGPRDSKQLAWERLVGEIAFQLDRRILSSIFPERVRLYGFTVSNIPEKIIQASMNPSSHKLDEELCQTLTQRYVSIMNRLQSLGYNGRVHPALTEQLVNAYGILRERPELAASEGGSYTVDFLQRVLVETVHPSMLTDALLLLSCLSQLAHDDGKPMFIW